jgi:hypothetical protein
VQGFITDLEDEIEKIKFTVAEDDRNPLTTASFAGENCLVSLTIIFYETLLSQPCSESQQNINSEQGGQMSFKVLHLCMISHISPLVYCESFQTMPSAQEKNLYAQFI